MTHHHINYLHSLSDLQMIQTYWPVSIISCNTLSNIATDHGMEICTEKSGQSYGQ